MMVTIFWQLSLGLSVTQLYLSLNSLGWMHPIFGYGSLPHPPPLILILKQTHQRLQLLKVEIESQNENPTPKLNPTI